MPRHVYTRTALQPGVVVSVALAALTLSRCGQAPEMSELSADLAAEPKRTTVLTGPDGEPLLGEAKGGAAAPATHRGVSGDTWTVDATWRFPSNRMNKLRVLIIVDHSGSMAFNDPDENNCGRLAAAQQLLDSFQKKMTSTNDTVEVALVKFSDNGSLLSGFVKLADFKSADAAKGKLNKDNFCLRDGSTNYVDAFAKARDAITALGAADGKQTPIAAYFITDGMPTNTPQEAKDAAKPLRDALTQQNPSSTLNAVFLGASGGTGPGKPNLPPAPNTPAGPPAPNSSTTPSDGGASGPAIALAADDETVEAEALLTEIVGGDKSRVKTVSDAAGLAQALAEFKLPAPTLDQATVVVEYGSAAAKKKCNNDADCKFDVKINDDDTASKFNVVVTFKLSGKEGKTELNFAEISAKRTDSSDVKAKASVNFQSVR